MPFCSIANMIDLVQSRKSKEGSVGLSRGSFCWTSANVVFLGSSIASVNVDASRASSGRSIVGSGYNDTCVLL